MTTIIHWPAAVLRDGAYPYLFDGDLERLGKESHAGGGEGTVSFHSVQRTQLRALLAEMTLVMYAAKGVGLAAPQIGVPLQVAVIDIGDGKLLELVNPTMVATEGKVRGSEGCLSLPGCHAHIDRAAKVIVSYFRPDGTEDVLAAGGLLAIVLQHELDHLAGKTIAERCGVAARDIMRRTMTRTREHEARVREHEAKMVAAEAERSGEAANG